MKTSPGITVLLERLGRIVQNVTHDQGLKPTQWEALRYLARANRFSRTPSGLTAYLGMTKGTVSQTLNALERKGLIAKKAEPADKRQVRIELTAKGRRLLEQDPIEGLLSSASNLSAHDRNRLAETLETLITETLRQQGGRPFGVCKTCRYFRKHAKGGLPHYCSLLETPLSADDSEQICVEQERPLK